MTRDNLKANVAAEVDRGEQSLAEAETLLASRFFLGAASRAYYAAFHYARALVLTAGEEPRSHQGVAHLLSLLFVRTGRLPDDTSRMYASVQKFRESADYDSAFVLDEAGAKEAVSHARELILRIRGILTSQGLPGGTI